VHQLHQRAARSVLKALLPEQGSDLRGHKQSRQALLEASGYARRPKDFDALQHILDGELRLVTPTDPVQIEDGESRIENRTSSETGSASVDPRSSILDPRSSDQQYYQLTHDYLVPALRQWLTRKQRETRRGRAEVRLAERTALWAAKPQRRYLPAWWEWANICLFTRQRDWAPPQRQMMRAASRQHLLQAGVLVLLLALLGWASYEWSASLRASELVRALAPR
jgi:hypothetical protein